MRYQYNNHPYKNLKLKIMIGSILGDLAAWTWENDHSKFYQELVSKDASPSNYANFLIEISNYLINASNTNVLASTYKNFQSWQSILCSIVIGWISKKIEELFEADKSYSLTKNIQDLKACKFISLLIFELRQGYTKNEAAQVVVNDSSFRYYTKDKSLYDSESIIGLLVRSWKAFYDSFDYGSAIHNSIKLPGDRHLNAILVGALADAMYGCKYYLIKKKYGESCPIKTPNFIPKNILEIHRNNRYFFPKNNALTNVEKQIWKDVDNPYKDKVISIELHRRIVKAMYTGWENRYGFYLDDGWEYVYRSFVLICRFKIEKQSDGTYRIRHLQISEDEHHLGKYAMEEALYSVEYEWFLYSGEKN